MSYILSMICGLSSLLMKKSKIIMLMIGAFIVIVFSFVENIPDYPVYQFQYNSGSNIFYSEPIYVAMERIFSKLGLEYIQFRIILCLLLITLLVMFIVKYSPYPAIALFFYTIYPFPVDVIQVRSAIASSIVIFSISFIIEYHESKNIKYFFYFVLGILIATGFHYSAIFFSVLVVLFLKPKKYWLLVYFIIPIMIVASLTAIRFLLPIIGSVIGGHKADLWAASRKSFSIRNIVFLVVPRVSFVFLMLIFMKIEKSTLFKNSNLNAVLLDIKPHKKEYKELVQFHDLRINLILLLCVIYVYLYTVLEITVSGAYERLSRVPLILGTVLVCRLINNAQKRNRIIMWVGFIGFYVLYFIGVMFFIKVKSGDNYFDFVFRKVMENNSIIGS